MIDSVRLQNVRKHTDSSYEFSAGVNVIVGPNASGKTTVLESLALASIGRAPNTRPKAMLSNGQDWFRIDASMDSVERTVRYEPLKSQLRQLEIGGRKIGRLQQSHIKPIVWFDPEQLRLLRGSPARRREYLDIILSQLDPEYRLSLTQFNRALAQRNTLLKQSALNDQLFVWNVRLAEHAKRLIEARYRLVDRMQDSLSTIYANLSGSKKQINARYSSATPRDKYIEHLMAQLESGADRDRILGHTSFGPHRDDLVFEDANGQPLNQTASRGEVRTLVLALKVIEVEELSLIFNSKPILLFDDVFSELDGARRKAFTSALTDLQTIVTTTDADVVTKNFSQKANIIAL